MQTVLTKLGAESNILRFEKKEEIKNKLPSKIAVFENMIQVQTKKRADLFDKFRKDYLNSYNVEVDENLENLNKIYDLFIVGSDQVWNTEIPEVDTKYFLPFADPKKRFSYAASLKIYRLEKKVEERL